MVQWLRIHHSVQEARVRSLLQELGSICWVHGVAKSRTQPSDWTERLNWLRIRVCVTPWTGARRAPLSMGFSRQGYWSGVPCFSPGDFPDPGIEPASLKSPAPACRCPLESPGYESRGSAQHVSAGSSLLLCRGIVVRHQWPLPRRWVFTVVILSQSYTLLGLWRVCHACVHVQSLQSCLTRCDAVGSSPPGSPVHGILQESLLEWAAVPSSRGSSLVVYYLSS